MLLCAPAGDARGLAGRGGRRRGGRDPGRLRPADAAAGSSLRGAGARRHRVRGAARSRARAGAVARRRPQGRSPREGVCFAVPARDGEDRVEALAPAIADLAADRLVAVCDPGEFRQLLAIAAPGRCAVLVKAEPGARRPLIALLAAEFREAGIPFKAWVPPIGAIGARRALAGLEPGGESGRRAERFASMLARDHGPARERAWAGSLRAERAQALPAVLGIAILVVALALALVAIGGAATAKGRLQRSVDLAALSAARSMRDDFGAAVRAGRAPERDAESRAPVAGRSTSAGLAPPPRQRAERNDLDAGRSASTFPTARRSRRCGSGSRRRAKIGFDGDERAGGGAETSAVAKAEVTIAAATASGPAPTASGGGYSGPLAYRQGKPMRPDVAVAFDRMAAAASAAGVTLTINSAYRSDAEQAAAVRTRTRTRAGSRRRARRCTVAGPSSTSGRRPPTGGSRPTRRRFGFVQRYSWEPWHYGFEDGPAPCSAEGDRARPRAAPSRRRPGRRRGRASRLRARAFPGAAAGAPRRATTSRRPCWQRS